MAATEPKWAKYWDELWSLLAPLHEAGWALPEDDNTSAEEDQDQHWILYQRLMRSCMVFEVVYEPHLRHLTFGPGADDLICDDNAIGEYDTFAEPIVIELHGQTEADWVAEIRNAARRHGLLDPTRVQVVEEDRPGWRQFLVTVNWKYILADTVSYQQKPPAEAVKRLSTDPACKEFFGWVDYAGGTTLADPVPTAAALGVAYWCWRHTVVEDWHATLGTVTDDVIAKCNMLNTKAVLAHTTVEEGVDWSKVIQALTDPDRQLPDGRKLKTLFGEGWQPVLAAVTERLTLFERAQHQLGPRAMLRLLSILGSSSYTSRWWGTGWWPDLCEQVITKFVQSDESLPSPYDKRGADALLADLTDHPELLPDDVLKVCRRDPSPKGGDGLRYLEVARPMARQIYPCIDSEVWPEQNTTQPGRR